MRSWDGHCPECHADKIELLVVRKSSLTKECAECKHRWREEREPELCEHPGYVDVNSPHIGE
jgi:hypothetical protein